MRQAARADFGDVRVVERRRGREVVFKDLDEDLERRTSGRCNLLQPCGFR